jgi:hypothetical protein
LGYYGSTSSLEHACENLGGGGLGPLVWEEKENEQTVHKPKLKFIYTRGSALQISANHVFKKNFKKKFQKISKKNIDFFWEIKKTGLPKLLRMS